MSISSDLSRIQTAKSGLASKIPASGLISTYPSQIQDIIDDANATTGETDTTLADAVGTLIDGYGQGGSGGIVITDTVDAAGGTIREITAQEISGTLSITQNGTYDVTQYASAEVNAKGEDLLAKRIIGTLTEYVADMGGGSYVNFAMQNFQQLVNVRLTNLGLFFGTNICNGCSVLETAEFHFNSVTGSGQSGLGGGAFANCPKLKKVVLHNPTYLWSLNTVSNTFDELVLDSNWIVKAGNNGVFNNIPAFMNGGTGGTIYIPKVMYDHLGDGSSLDYKAATNWSTFDSYGTITWATIEGSWYETHYADGTLK